MKNYNNEINKIWIESIRDSIIQVSSDLGLKHKSISYLEKRIKKIYHKQKKYFIDSYMSPLSPNIDRHKIAACVMKTIMIVKPIQIPFGAKIKFIFSNKKLYEIISSKLTESDYKYVLLVNEYLALSIATSIIDGFIAISDNKKRLKHQICLPDPFPEEDDDYLLDLCICLYYTKGRNISTITFSNIFFLLEKYSCRRIQCNNIENAYKNSILEQNPNIDKEELSKFLENTRLNITDNKYEKTIE